MIDNLFPGLNGTNLKCREDDYSYQFSVESSPRFWIRVEKPASRRIVISDFLFGDTNDDDAADYLSEALLRIDGSGIDEITFSNLGTAGSSDATQAANRLEHIMELYAASQERFLPFRGRSQLRGKLRLSVALRNVGLVHQAP